MILYLINTGCIVSFQFMHTAISVSFMQTEIRIGASILMTPGIIAVYAL